LRGKSVIFTKAFARHETGKQPQRKNSQKKGIVMASKKNRWQDAKTGAEDEKKTFWATVLETLWASRIGRWLECILATLLMAVTWYFYQSGWSFVEKPAASAVRFVAELKPKPGAPKIPAATVAATAKSPAGLVPAGYKIEREIKGDLNKDGLEDAVLAIDAKKEDSHGGLLIAFNKDGHYETALENRECFSYEGFNLGKCGDTPGEMQLSIKKGVLIIEYGDGCGGNYYHKTFKFRYQNSDFELIGYDVVSEEYNFIYERIVIVRTTSINFLTNKMQTKTNKAAKRGKEIFDEVWNDITVKEPLSLRKLENLYDFSYLDYITEK
jgi:hypothetical protein